MISDDTWGKSVLVSYDILVGVSLNHGNPDKPSDMIENFVSCIVYRPLSQSILSGAGRNEKQLKSILRNPQEFVLCM